MPTVASWNVNSLRVRLPHLATWLGSAGPDVIGLQETKLVDLLLASRELAASCESAWIDLAPRRLERPSDHAPVIARFGNE